MSQAEEERQDTLKVTRAFNENRDSSSCSLGRGGRGRENCTAQQQKADKSDAYPRLRLISPKLIRAGYPCLHTRTTWSRKTDKQPDPSGLGIDFTEALLICKIL